MQQLMVVNDKWFWKPMQSFLLHNYAYFLCARFWKGAEDRNYTILLTVICAQRIVELFAFVVFHRVELLPVFTSEWLWTFLKSCC